MVRRGLSNVIALMIVMFIMLSLLVPFIFYFSFSLSAKQVSTAVVNNYHYLKELQVKQVITGHPAIFYNGTIVLLQYSNGTFTPPSNFTIEHILYLNQQGIWVSVPLNYPIVVSASGSVNLPQYVSNRPIVIVTSLGNIFFLTPGSGIGPFSTAGKGGLEIIAQIQSYSSIYQVFTNVTTNIYGAWKNFTTPIAFPNQTGSFQAKVPKYVFYQFPNGSIITGVFHNWKVLGVANLNSTLTPGISVTLKNQPAVLIANYSILYAYAILTIQTNYPGTVVLSIDGTTYYVTGSQQIQVPAGFMNVTVKTLQGNDTSQTSNGIIKHYSYSYMQYQTTTTKATSAIFFIPPNSQQTLYVQYTNDYNYYKVYLKAENNTYGNQIQIGNQLYNYGSSIWIINGNYTFAPLGKFTGTYTYGAVTVYFQYNNGTTNTYKFPKIPRYVIINQPMTIDVVYGVLLYWTSL